MATTYKFRAVGVETLTAQLFADQIEVHSSHELRTCTTYQWFYDDLTGSGPTAIAMATNQTYDVDTNSVGNSGEYFCRITVGTTGDCVYDTQVRRITIIECIAPTSRLFNVAGGAGEAIVEAPHYETPVFNTEGATFITAGTLVPCDASAAGTNVCRFVQNYTVASNAGSSSPREAQLTITVGELVCFYNVGQDRVVSAPPQPTMDAPPAGPFINLTDNGPVFAAGPPGGIIRFPALTPITVTAEVGTVGGTGTETYTVAWTGATVNPSNDREATVAGREAVGPVTVTATVTSSTGGTATASIDVEFTAFVIPGADNFTTVMGDTTGQVQWRVLRGLGPGNSPRGMATNSGSFEIGGPGNWNITLNWYNGFFGGASTAGEVTLTVTGPGVNQTLAVTPSNLSREVEITAQPGQYTWDLRFTQDAVPDVGNYANVHMLIVPRNF